MLDLLGKDGAFVQGLGEKQVLPVGLPLGEDEGLIREKFELIQSLAVEGSLGAGLPIHRAESFIVYHTDIRVPGNNTENLVEVGELCVTATRL